METLKLISRSWSLVALVASMAILCAAMQPNPTTTQDKTFVTESTEGSLAEVELGKLALKKSKNPEVVEFAQKMITDHTRLVNDMKPIADQMGVTLPEKVNIKHEQEVDRLSALSGDQFDKAYITAMVADHHPRPR